MHPKMKSREWGAKKIGKEAEAREFRNKVIFLEREIRGEDPENPLLSTRDTKGFSCLILQSLLSYSYNCTFSTCAFILVEGLAACQTPAICFAFRRFHSPIQTAKFLLNSNCQQDFIFFFSLTQIVLPTKIHFARFPISAHKELASDQQYARNCFVVRLGGCFWFVCFPIFFFFFFSLLLSLPRQVLARSTKFHV